MQPTGFHASPLENFTFDILNAAFQQVSADLFVSPDGDNANDGLTPETPLKTIHNAMNIIIADVTNALTIHLANGIYSQSTNGEIFPIEIFSFINLSGQGEEITILDANNTISVLVMDNCTNNIICNLAISGGNGYNYPYL